MDRAKVPPILPNIQEQLRDFILNPKLEINDAFILQKHFQRKPDPSRLLFCDLSNLSTDIRMERDPTSGKLIGLAEINTHTGQVVKNSVININEIPQLLDEARDFDLDLQELLKKPDSFGRGYDFDGGKAIASGVISNKGKIDSQIVDLSLLLRNIVVPGLEEKSPVAEEAPQVPLGAEISDEDALAVLDRISQEVPLPTRVLHISTSQSSRCVTSTEWAEMLDVSQPIIDFEQRIPNPAFKYEFELDPFQKQAILKLEEHCNVLVSAHTSAGKTVVAEYAIALSQRHLTRTIYTSPIKALSNQKYREFRRTFHDVGLVTGDFQVNATGTCLVVTTEILRSMLLAHNDVIRDLEFVIFDEVHYINDMERGHVWEEVVILLPAHVSIVMLSATVPNALQFADWVGRTKQRRMYVVSTLHRPVPLKHYLYTGSGGSTKHDRFLILDNSKFMRPGYMQAVQSVQKKPSKAQFGPRDRQARLNPKQESTMWVALMEHLLSRDELPVVAFTLSRKRCDQNAEALTLDLTDAKQKNHIRHFFRQSILRLNQADRDLPQILQLQRLLERGVGVHHSGILPILKEIVELLFQEKCVKVLFATETFAMGVNMPAKTVVFDSVYKFDGLSKRLLLPSEYIQMAGRAGRRGLDDNGNVLILCKGVQIPHEEELVSMMIGQPKKIESQFRLTYSIILKLERKRVAAEGKVTVEEMMASSFMEAENVKKRGPLQSKLKLVNQALAEADVSPNGNESLDKLQTFARLGLEFLELWFEMSPKVFQSKSALKYLVPGRVINVTHGSHVNKLGVLLAIESKKNLNFRVLMLHDPESLRLEDSTGFHKLVALAKPQVYLPEKLGGHVVMSINPWDILDVTTELIKLDSKIVIHDWENRQIPRFQNNAPGQTFQRVIEELVAITHKVQMSNKLETVPIFKDLPVTSDKELHDIRKMTEAKKALQNTNLEDIIDWEQKLTEVFRLRHLEKEKSTLQYLLSYQSMSLYDDYQSRLNVLKELGYVDSRNSVQMKGNVACEMSSHEILITELVLRNTLNHLQPPEIAALLSCFVYQGKETGPPPSVSPALNNAILIVREVEQEILVTEKKCSVQPVDPYSQERNLNFDLIRVVYEWALNKPFAQIMLLTDIQEGIIVRCIQQLNETIKDVRDAARIIGEPSLQQKMEEASTAIKRDIVFTASLYMQS